MNESAGGGEWTIVGQGLAGTCVAWEFWRRGVDFRIVDREQGGSSRVAAGLLNPITGKNFEPSWRIGEFLPEALDFYARIEAIIGVKLWFPLPVLRLAASEKEWRKIRAKLDDERVSPWLGEVSEPPPGWVGAVEVTGGGRVDTRAFVDGSREFFRERGLYSLGEVGYGPGSILCEGAAGLMTGRYGPHRSAKGEILTVRAAGWDEGRIRVGAGGWLIPLGGGLFRAGATYEWNELDEVPTEKGRARVEEILKCLGGKDFTIVDHLAGIRPILRRSEPLIGPIGDKTWIFNGLGSKGALYAPAVARKLLDWMLEGTECELDIDYRDFVSNKS